MPVSDEPRRSGRATKGQHKNLEGSAEPGSKPKKSGKSKAAKKNNEPTPSDQEDEDDEEGGDTIRCICGDTGDDVEGRAFIFCEGCEVWQHNICMGVPEAEDQQPEHYFCEVCAPADHEETLEAMKKGETIWLDRQKEAVKNKRKGNKRKSKGGRKSRVSDIKPEGAAASSSPAPAASQEPSNKRKFEEENSQTPLPSTAAPLATKPPPARTQDSKQTPAPERIEKRRKSDNRGIKNGASNGNDVHTAIVDVSRLPKERQNVAVALSKVIADGIRDRSKAGAFRIPDGHTADSLSKYHGSLIEYGLIMNHGDQDNSHTPAYAQQFRQVHANLKKNDLLLDRILKGSLSADELATMSSQDMASEELQKQRAQLKEEVDKQAVMLREDDQPRMRRTHKGDEYVDDENQQASTESVFSAKPVRHRESMDVDMSDATGPSYPENGTVGAHSPKVGMREPPSSIDTSRPPPQAPDRRASSQQFDINNVWAKTQQSPDSEHPSSRPLQQPPRRRSSIPKQERAGNQTNDADIDRLLADDNDDAYSPADVGSSDPTLVFRGKLVQPGVTELTATGRYIAGNDFSRYIPWPQFLPDLLEIEGRLEKTKADDYLCGLQWSTRSDVTVLAVTPYDNREAFDTIFNYFSTRGRYAVGKRAHNISPLVKDIYISPVEAGTKPPPHIELLDHCSLEFPLTERMLLATFVVNTPADWGAIPGMPTEVSSQAGQSQDLGNLPPHLRNQAGMAASPISAQAPAFSPRPSQGFTPADSGSSFGGGSAYNGSLPPNPYQAGQIVQQPPQQTLPPQPGHLSQVQQILGPFANAPVVLQIVSAAEGQTLGVEMLHNMRHVLDQHPAASDDMNAFYGYLRAPPQ